jgi:hypothetical protein
MGFLTASVVPAALLLVSSAAFGAEGAYQLDMGTTVRQGSLNVAPHVTGPAGKALRYEMVVTRQSQSGSSNSSQAGSVRLDQSGSARLASNTMSVSPQDNYRVTVRLYEQDRLVAEQSVRHP